MKQEESDGSAAEEVDLVPGGDLHRATPLNLEKGEEGALQSYGVCAVSLYDYQVYKKNLLFKVFKAVSK